MLKKIFKAVTAFTLLVGCYFGYVQVFAIVVRQLTTVRRAQKSCFTHRDSRFEARIDQARQGRDASRPLGNQE